MSAQRNPAGASTKRAGNGSRARNGARSVSEQLRAAIERTFDATLGERGISRDRAQDLVDEVTEAAEKLRKNVWDELRTAASAELGQTRKRIDTLEKRLADLENRIRPKSSTNGKSRSAAVKPSASGTSSQKAAGGSKSSGGAKASTARKTASTNSNASTASRAKAKPAARPATKK